MRRKKSKPPASSAAEEQDLAYLVHDRVALLGAAFSALRPRELRALAPAAARGLDDRRLREMCLDELLGISSKRLCAVLDGAEPPTDTETSTSESESSAHGDTIDLDSSGSSESQPARRASRGGAGSGATGGATSGATSGATGGAGGVVGASVLQLLELSARARALRAQLAAAPAPAAPAPPPVKLEPVVCISSDDDRPAPPTPPDNTPRSKKKKKRKAKNKAVAPAAPSPAPVPEAPPPAPSSTGADTGTALKEETSDIVVLDSSPEREPTTERETAKDRDADTPTDFTITIPRDVTTVRKIQLNKNNVVISVPNRKDIANVSTPKATKTTNSVATPKTKPPVSVATRVPTPANVNSTVTKVKQAPKLKSVVAESQNKNKVREDKGKRRSKHKSRSDDDGITLQVSDSEKLELLENLDQNKESDSVDSESDSKDSDSDITLDTSNSKASGGKEDENFKTVDSVKDVSLKNGASDRDSVHQIKEVTVTSECVDEVYIKKVMNTSETSNGRESNVSSNNINISNNNIIEVKCIEDIPLMASDTESEKISSTNNEQSEECTGNSDGVTQNTTSVTNKGHVICDNDHVEPVEETEMNIQSDKEESATEVITPVEDNVEKVEHKVDTETSENLVKSPMKANSVHSEEGEISDKSSSDVEALDIKPEVFIISDDETKVTKKKKKKDKKKKSKKYKKQDFSAESDDNFRRKAETIDKENTDEPKAVKDSAVSTETKVAVHTSIQTDEAVTIDIDSDNAYEVLEISDDSSCYEFEGVTVSKEPTAEEIEALSAKLDEIQRVDVVTGETIPDKPAEPEDLESVSWKDRYLDSAKVKNVLKTANILNALRKKNKELKRKLLESKSAEVVAEKPLEVEKEEELIAEPVEGSIEHFNTLQGSSKYVDPVTEPPEVIDGIDQSVTDEVDKNVVTDKDKTEHDQALQKEMKKDAKQLLKMYKRLLKYNDMNKQKPKDPNKKKKKKKKNTESAK